MSLPSVGDLPNVLPTTSGRAAIFLALQAAKIQAGKGVLLPTYHCPTMVAPAVLFGLPPLFYPVDADGLPDLDSIPMSVADGAGAMLVAHLFGIPKSLARIRAWCDARQIVLIEDCAHSLYGQAGERPIGGWGDYATASLSKFHPIPEGGLLASYSRPLSHLELSRPTMADQLKGLWDVVHLATSHGQLTGLGGPISAIHSLRHRHRSASAVDNGQHTADTEASYIAACDLARIDHQPLICSRLISMLPEEAAIRKRRENFNAYLAAFQECPNASPLIDVLPQASAPYVFPLLINAADRIYDTLRKAGLPVFRWDRLWPGTPTLHGDFGRLWSRQVIQILCHQSLEPEAVRCIAERIIEELQIQRRA